MVHRHACWQNLIHIRYNIHIFLMINQINCGIQMETTGKLNVTPVRRGAINQIKSNKDWGACSEKGTLPHTHLYHGCLQLTVMGVEPCSHQLSKCLLGSTTCRVVLESSVCEEVRGENDSPLGWRIEGCVLMWSELPDNPQQLRSPL